MVLFVDDLKTYHKSESKAAVTSLKLKQMFGDIGLEWGLKKCAAVNIKRGKIAQEQTQRLSNLSVKQEHEPNIHQPSLIALND